MSDTTEIQTLAVRYADADNTARNAADRLTAHADWASYVGRYDSKVRGSANALAREVLGLPADEPIKVGPKGDQRVTVNGRRIESVARLITRSADKGETAVALRVTLSGEGGGSTVVPADHPLYAELVKLATGA